MAQRPLILAFENDMCVDEKLTGVDGQDGMLEAHLSIQAAHDDNCPIGVVAGHITGPIHASVEASASRHLNKGLRSELWQVEIATS